MEDEEFDTGKRALNVTRGSCERSRDQSRAEPWELTAARLRKAWNRVVKIQHGSPCEPWQDLGSRWLARMSSVNQYRGPVPAEESESPSHSPSRWPTDTGPCHTAGPKRGKSTRDGET